jgi:hypothetical protein
MSMKKVLFDVTQLLNESNRWKFDKRRLIGKKKYGRDLSKKSANWMIKRQEETMPSLEMDFRFDHLESSSILVCRCLPTPSAFWFHESFLWFKLKFKWFENKTEWSELKLLLVFGSFVHESKSLRSYKRKKRKWKKLRIKKWIHMKPMWFE